MKEQQDDCALDHYAWDRWGWPAMPPAAPKVPTSPAAMEFGHRVRELRHIMELSQEALALRCGVHWTFLGQVERGQRSVRLENILKIAAGLDVQPGRLLDGLPVE